jgi:hypothetical protein
MERLNLFEETKFELLILWFALPKWIIRSYNSLNSAASAFSAASCGELQIRDR